MATEVEISSEVLLQKILNSLTSSPASYLKAAREIESLSLSFQKKLSLYFLSTFTCDLLKPYIQVESARKRLSVKVDAGPFNQLEQEVLDPSSKLYTLAPDVIVIAWRLEEAAPELIFDFLNLSPKEIESSMDALMVRANVLLSEIRRRLGSKVLFFDFTPGRFLAAGLADATLALSQQEASRQINARLAKLCKADGNAYVFEYGRLIAEVGEQDWFDPRIWYMSRTPMSVQAQISLAKRLTRYLRALYLPRAKCLVLDLDNTLWGGILGEDGFGGIQLGEEYPGRMYKDFQRQLKLLTQRGVLLAIASKNNAEEALAVLEKHEDCLLRLRDIAAYQIHWDDKAQSLKQIAKELNIGTDALVFFDDNPMEREWIRMKMPEVTVIDVPNDPALFFQSLDSSGAFDQLCLSEEDRNRSSEYQREKTRKEIQTKSLSLEDFLIQLKMEASFGYIDESTIGRVTQLLSKTNQFNLTTRRHDAQAVRNIVCAGVGLWIRVKDQFGDYGLIGIAIAVPESAGTWRLDTFLLSCRVIGRKIEDVMLGLLAREIERRGATSLLGEYIETEKNKVVADFFSRMNFQPVVDRKGFWKKELREGAFPIPNLINVRFADGS